MVANEVSNLAKQSEAQSAEIGSLIKEVLHNITTTDENARKSLNDVGSVVNRISQSHSSMKSVGEMMVAIQQGNRTLAKKCEDSNTAAISIETEVAVIQ